MCIAQSMRLIKLLHDPQHQVHILEEFAQQVKREIGTPDVWLEHIARLRNGEVNVLPLKRHEHGLSGLADIIHHCILHGLGQQAGHISVRLGVGDEFTPEIGIQHLMIDEQQDAPLPENLGRQLRNLLRFEPREGETTWGWIEVIW